MIMYTSARYVEVFLVYNASESLVNRLPHLTEVDVYCKARIDLEDIVTYREDIDFEKEGYVNNEYTTVIGVNGDYCVKMPYKEFDMLVEAYRALRD